MSAFHARILASDTLFFDGDCEFMVVPCTDGAMGILSHHSNMIAAVVPEAIMTGMILDRVADRTAS